MKDMRTTAYRTGQLKPIADSLMLSNVYPVKIKLYKDKGISQGNDVQTNWLDITDDEFKAISDILTK